MARYPTATRIDQPLSNGTTLETVLQDPLPPSSPSSPDPPRTRGLAILAHPLGRLGGTLHDPVLTTLHVHLLHAHYRTLRFNSRGIGTSSGSPSWTGSAEAEDLALLVSHALDQFERDHPEPGRIQLVLVGYSAGGLYASRLDRTAWHPRGRTVVEPRLVLLSFPLDKVWALSLFRSAAYAEALERLLSPVLEGMQARLRPNDGEEAGRRQRDGTVSLLALYGDQDQFTRASSYDGWVRQLRSVVVRHDGVDSRVQAHCFEGVDHFWRDTEVRDRMAERVVAWLTGIEPSAS